MLAGKRSDGKAIFNIKTGSDEYSPLYAEYKGKKKPIDLKDKGPFQEGLLVDVRTNSFVLTSADEKTKMLQENYGKEIIGLNNESKKAYSPKLKKELISVTSKQLSHD